MSNKKKSKRNYAYEKKMAVEALRHQTRFGLKKIGVEEESIIYQLVENEIRIISELNLEQDILDMKKFIDNVKHNCQAAPVQECGNLAKNIVALALGISSAYEVEKIEKFDSFKDLLQKKLLTIFFQEEIRNEIVNWAKENGYNTSTYLGRPIVKFKNIYLIIERLKLNC